MGGSGRKDIIPQLNRMEYMTARGYSYTRKGYHLTEWMRGDIKLFCAYAMWTLSFFSFSEIIKILYYFTTFSSSHMMRNKDNILLMMFSSSTAAAAAAPPSVIIISPIILIITNLMLPFMGDGGVIILENQIPFRLEAASDPLSLGRKSGNCTKWGVIISSLFTFSYCTSKPISYPNWMMWSIRY